MYVYRNTVKINYERKKETQSIIKNKEADKCNAGAVQNNDKERQI